MLAAPPTYAPLPPTAFDLRCKQSIYKSTEIGRDHGRRVCHTEGKSCIGQVLRFASTQCQWPGLTVPIDPSNSQLRLYGGAAFERCLAEFQEAASKLTFPSGAILYSPTSSRMLHQEEVV